MPLTERVMFTGVLQRSNCVQVPKDVRWRFQVESSQLLKVGVSFEGLHKGWQVFYGKMRKDGRLGIPKLVLWFFRDDQQSSLEGCPLQVTLETA